MAITRHTPRSPMGDLDLFSTRMNRMFDEPWFPLPAPNAGWAPVVNVEETPDALLLTAEVPGLTEADVEVEIENNILTIHGEKREEHEETDKERQYHVWERRFGSFHRAFTLPRTVVAEKIQATFDSGILLVRMPKSGEAKSRRIEIKKG